MNAIILAAGTGSRLRPVTDRKPKTMVKVNGKPMLGHILDALRANGIYDICICTGYKADMIREYCSTAHADLSIDYILNEDYNSTNNMYSLYLARSRIKGDFILMNADLVFDPGIIQGLLESPGSRVAVESGVYYEESMKVELRLDGTICSISKKIPRETFFGSSIDVYKFDRDDRRGFIEELVSYIEDKKDRKQWTEVLLNQLFASGKVKARPYAINPAKWFEIDNFEDLARAEILFNGKIIGLKNRKVVFIDRDGTLAMNDTALPGANEFLSKVRQTGKKLFLLTNNSSKTPEEHCRFVNQLGIKVTQEEVIVSIDLAIAELKRLGLIRVFWLAGGKVSEYITRAGLTFDNEAPQALLLTFDNEITYSKLVNFSMLARKGFPYYATHIDQVCPSKDGLIPDIGCFIDTIECTTGRRPTKTFGKPSIDMVTPILEGLGLNFSDAVVIGDRLYTDIRMAEGTEMLSALVLTGETDRNTYEESQTVADIVVPGISDLTPWL